MESKFKQSIVLVIFFLFVLPLLIKVVIFSVSVVNKPPEDSAQEMANLMEGAAVPWWVDVIDKLADLGTLGALLIIGIVWVLQKFPEIR